jgi:hypothetical protein
VLFATVITTTKSLTTSRVSSRRPSIRQRLWETCIIRPQATTGSERGVFSGHSSSFLYFENEPNHYHIFPFQRFVFFHQFVLTRLQPQEDVEPFLKDKKKLREEMSQLQVSSRDTSPSPE